MTGVIAQEWFARIGGSEQVADKFAAMLPDARVASLWNDTPARYGHRPIEESWLARTPLRRHKAMALPFMPSAWERLVRPDVDYVLASSHLFAHHAGHNLDVPRLAYVHSPARYLWSPEIDARGGSPVVRAAAQPWKRLDRRRAAGLTTVAANSSAVRDRIREYWDVDASVIHPPVDTDFFGNETHVDRDLLPSEVAQLEKLASGFLLGASRFIGYKRLDLLVKAAGILRVPVVLVGAGPHAAALAALADQLGVNMKMLLAPRREVVRWLMANASVLVFPGLEDFGIIPVEAMAAGTPVVARRQGGTGETVADGVSGVLVESEDPHEWANAASRAQALSSADCRSRAQHFSEESFQYRIESWLAPHIKRP